MGDAGSLLFGGVIFLWLLFAAIAVGGLALSIWMIVDAAQRPDWQFQATGQTKVLWVVLGVVGIAVCQLAGLIAGPIYLLSVRRRLQAVPPPAYGYGYGYGYGYPAYGGPGQPPPGDPGGRAGYTTSAGSTAEGGASDAEPRVEPGAVEPASPREPPENAPRPEDR